MIICPATPADTAAIERLLDARFGPARHNRTAYRLRDGVVPDPALSFVMRDSTALVGSVQCWPLQLRLPGGGVRPLTLLGPVATALDREGQGIATRLVAAALAAVDTLAAPPVLLIGDVPFYGRFGFSSALTAGWVVPGPVDRARLLLRGGDDLPGAGWVEAGGGVRRAA